jgi:hypothetical protein
MDHKNPRLNVGPAFDELTGFHRGEAPMSQPEDMYASGPHAMNISAKHNADPLKPNQKAVRSEPQQYK